MNFRNEASLLESFRVESAYTAMLAQGSKVEALFVHPFLSPPSLLTLLPCPDDFVIVFFIICYVFMGVVLMALIIVECRWRRRQAQSHVLVARGRCPDQRNPIPLSVRELFLAYYSHAPRISSPPVPPLNSLAALLPASLTWYLLTSVLLRPFRLNRQLLNRDVIASGKVTFTPPSCFNPHKARMLVGLVPTLSRNSFAGRDLICSGVL